MRINEKSLYICYLLIITMLFTHDHHLLSIGRFLYITVLRDPFNRYVSEYKHVRRGATWKSARLQCNGRQASLEEVPFCFDGN